MPRVMNVRLLRGAIVAMLLTATGAGTGTVFAATPANSTQPRVLVTPRTTRSASSSDPVNPLRTTSATKISQSAQATKTVQPEDRSATASTPPAPTKSLIEPPRPFVPNTGRLQIFREATKANSAERAVERGPLFPQGTAPSGSSAKKHIMRYQDVSRGAALVPIKPRNSDAAIPAQTAPGQKPPTEKQPAAATPPPVYEPEPAVKRLPPLDRTAPRPKLPPGVKLPQEPIKIYPETDS
jgi:hypothetical protein